MFTKDGKGLKKADIKAINAARGDKSVEEYLADFGIKLDEE
jgi:hypothetical protein